MTAAADTRDEAAATTDESQSSLALVGAGHGGRPVPTPAGDTKKIGRQVGRLFAEHSRMVFALCNVLLRDREEAEDATQQCFLSAQKSMLAGTTPDDAAAWLAAIARNECLSRLRRRRPATVALRDDDLLSDVEVAEIVDRRAEITALSEAIAGLPPAQRQAVLLRDFYGLSYREVSLALGVSGPAVESLLFRSRKRLQDRLRPFHAARGVAAVPAAIREALIRAIPGFSGGLPGAGAGAAGAGLSAKLLSGQAAAKVAALALAAGAGTMALDHEPAKLLRRPPPTPHLAATRAPAIREVVTRPPDAVSTPLHALYVERRATPTLVADQRHPVGERKSSGQLKTVATPSSSRTPTVAATVAVSAATTTTTPVVAVPEPADPLPRPASPLIPLPRTPSIPAAPNETTTQPGSAENHDADGGRSTSGGGFGGSHGDDGGAGRGDTSGPGPGTSSSGPGPDGGSSGPGPGTGSSGPGPGTGSSGPGPGTGSSGPDPGTGSSGPDPGTGSSGPDPGTGSSGPDPGTGSSGPGPGSGSDSRDTGEPDVGTSGGPGSDDGAAQGSTGSPDDAEDGLAQTTTIATTTTEPTAQTTTTSGDPGRQSDDDHGSRSDSEGDGSRTTTTD